MNRPRTRARLLAALLVVSALARTAPVSFAATERKLHDGAASIDELVNHFLDALAKKDGKALRGLRVDREEYIDLILRGNVPVGAPLRDWPDGVNEYWWSMLHTKSAYWEANILAGLGGHHYRLKHVEYAKGTKQYATYTAYKQLRLVVEDGAGEAHEIRTGSIADLGGHFKFISFIRD